MANWAFAKQISTIVNDSVSAALGSSKTITTTDFVSLGKELSVNDLYASFYKNLVNRIVKTLYYVRVYERNERHILRDESEYGAFVQKVYYYMPKAVNDPAFDLNGSVTSFTQESPYDVNTVIEVSAKCFGGQGVWSLEFVRPIEQIKSAFLGAAEMAAFIDGIYVTAENAMKLELDSIERAAVNTGIAAALSSSNGAQKVNLLTKYNAMKAAADSTWTAITAAAACSNADFLKFAGKVIKAVTSRMGEFGSYYNAKSYPTFTPADKLVLEVQSDFAACMATYLEADTYHKEMVALPNYGEVNFWQMQDSGTTADLASANSTSISVINANINSGKGVSQAGIVAVARDMDAVAAYFGNRKSWEMVNPRSDVVIHGEKARKGYAVDEYCNFVVFYIADET